MTENELYILKNEGYEFIKEEIVDKNNRREKRIFIKHLLCGKEYDCRKSGFFNENKRCTCQRKNNKSLIKDTSSFQDYLDNKFGKNEYLLITDYINRKKPITLKHKCGFIYEIKRAEYLLDSKEQNSGTCPVCNGTKNSIERMNILFSNLNLNIEIAQGEEFKPGKQKYNIFKKDCKHTFEKNYIDILNTKKCECPICKTKHRKNIDIDYVKQEINNLDDSYEVLSNEYKGTHELLDIWHKKCMRVYKVSRTNFLSGKRCPYCALENTTSASETEILNFIKKFENCYKEKFIREDKSYYEVDIFCPERNIGFEYDGLYWHSEDKKGKTGHINKTKYFNEKDIKIVHIFSDEWQFKQDIIKDKIKSILGVQKEKIYARKCSIKEINSRERNQFLEINHIQGADGATISLGLFYNDELVAVMSFSKLRKSLGQKKSIDGVYELSRFAGKLNYTIVGGFSKLLNYAIKNYDIKEILTYADLRFTSYKNNVYDKNGFVLDHISEPSYWYIDKSADKREHRYKYRKQELKKLFPLIYSDDKSESEIMKEAGYTRIWDCGNLVYRMKIKK